MQEHKIGDIQLLSYKSFDSYRNVSNVVTTRIGGQSSGPYKGLNLGLHVGDDPELVLENRAIVCQALGLEPETLTIPQQIHGDGVAVATAADRGGGAIVDDDALAGADGLVTDVPELPLAVLIADCVAVSLFDTKRRAIGIAHAGWKGSLKGIAEKAVARMTEAFGSAPADIIAGISPSIGRGHYEVGQEVFDAFKEAFGRESSQFLQEDMDGTCYLDLWTVNELQLRSAGLSPENIAIAEMCTACHGPLFYSHRHDGGTTGRFANIICLHKSASRSY